MKKFEVEVWKKFTYQNCSKCQAMCLNIPPCLTFYMRFNWETFLHKSCSYLKDLQNYHQFHVIWILNDRVMHFWSLTKSLDQWYRSKVTYNVASYHMFKEVELAPTPNIKVELYTFKCMWPISYNMPNSLKCVVPYHISYHKNWASYGLGKLTSKLGYRQNDL